MTTAMPEGHHGSSIGALTFVVLFRADAIWTTGHGKRLFGRGAISTFTHQVLPGGMQGTAGTFEVERVLFIRPDVAAVKVRQVYRTSDGRTWARCCSSCRRRTGSGS